MKVLPAHWTDLAIQVSRRGPGHARALATVLEGLFTEPWERDLRIEAEILGRWLRAVPED